MAAFSVDTVSEVPGIDVQLLLEAIPQNVKVQDIERCAQKSVVDEYEYFHPMEYLDNRKHQFDFKNNKDILPHTTPFSELAKTMLSIDTKGWVKKKILRAGVGKPIEEGTMVLVDYEMFYEGEKEPFDSTLKRKRPLKMIVMPGHILDGLFEALLTMLVQEASRLLLNYNVAFGENGFPPRIKPKASILVEIELKKILEVAAPDDLTGEFQINGLTVAEVVIKADKMIEHAKTMFRDRRFKDSKNMFRDCKRLIEHTSTHNDSDNQQLMDLKVRVLSNLAGVYSFLNQHEHVCVLCEELLGIDPKNARGFLLHARALTRLLHFRKSATLLIKAMELYPHDHDFVKEYTRLSEKKKAHDLRKKQETE